MVIRDFNIDSSFFDVIYGERCDISETTIFSFQKDGLTYRVMSHDPYLLDNLYSSFPNYKSYIRKKRLSKIRNR